MIDTESVKKFVELTKRKKDIRQELSFVQEELDILEKQIEEMFIEEGVPSMKLGKTNVYLRTQMFVSPKRREDIDETTDDAKARACQALRAAGLGWLVAEGFNANTLRSALKEMKEEDGCLPHEIEAAFNITERFRVGVRG